MFRVMKQKKGEIHIDIFVFDYAKQYIPVVKRIVSSVANFFQIAKLDQYEKQWLYERFASQKSKLCCSFRRNNKEISGLF